MPDDMASARDEAERLFLGREDVVGVALSRRVSPEIVVFLKTGLPEIAAEIRKWGEKTGVDVSVKVTGSFRSAS